jgi:hypothetical protein
MSLKLGYYIILLVDLIQHADQVRVENINIIIIIIPFMNYAAFYITACS